MSSLPQPGETVHYVSPAAAAGPDRTICRDVVVHSVQARHDGALMAAELRWPDSDWPATASIASPPFDEGWQRPGTWHRVSACADLQPGWPARPQGLQATDIYGTGPYCWKQPPGGRLIACDRMKDHRGKHSWEDEMPGSIVTVMTASGEKRFAADDWLEDDEHNLTVLDGRQKVARFRDGEWTGVHLPEREQDDRVVLEGRA